MSGLDMSEAIRMLANEKNISVDALLHVMVDALATAYKRRPNHVKEALNLCGRAFGPCRSQSISRRTRFASVSCQRACARSAASFCSRNSL